MAGCSPTVMRIVPAGLSRNSLSAASSFSISSNWEATVRRSRPPAAVDTTLRLVGPSNRRPSRSSRLRIVWLSADGDTPSLAAARVKLCSFATMAKVARSLNLKPVAYFPDPFFSPPEGCLGSASTIPTWPCGVRTGARIITAGGVPPARSWFVSLQAQSSSATSSPSSLRASRNARGSIKSPWRS